MRTKSLSAILLAVILFGTFTPSTSFAAKASCGPTYCTDEIDRIYVTHGRVYVSIEDRKLAQKTLNCKLESDYYFTLLQSHSSFDQIFALLLDAKGKTTEGGRNRVTIRIVDNSPNCEISYVVVDWPN